MTAPLPARLLAFRDAAESTNDDEGNDGRATYVPVSLQTFRQTMEEAAAALSGGEAVGEYDLRLGLGQIAVRVMDDPVMVECCRQIDRLLATTPQPGGGVVVPREQLARLRELFQSINEDDDGDYYMSDSCDGMEIIDGLLPAAPSAKGVA